MSNAYTRVGRGWRIHREATPAGSLTRCLRTGKCEPICGGLSGCGAPRAERTPPQHRAWLDSGQVTTWASWHRWTAISLLAYIFLAVAAAWQRTRDSSAGLLELVPVTIPELLRQLRGTVIPQPRRDKAHRDAWALWRRRHQYHARQAHQRWHAYADEQPR